MQTLRSLTRSLHGTTSLIVFDLICEAKTSVHENDLAVQGHLHISTVRKICVLLRDERLIIQDDARWAFDAVQALTHAKDTALACIQANQQKQTAMDAMMFRCQVCNGKMLPEEAFQHIAEGNAPRCCDQEMEECIAHERSLHDKFTTVVDDCRQVLMAQPQ